MTARSFAAFSSVLLTNAALALSVPAPSAPPDAVRAVSGSYEMRTSDRSAACTVVLGPTNRDAAGEGRDDFQVEQPFDIDCIKANFPALGGVPSLWNVEKGGAIALYLDEEPRKLAALFLPARDSFGAYMADVGGTKIILLSMFERPRQLD